MTFTKLPGRRYEMRVARERGPELAPRNGPGYHDWLPHDAVHFLIEAEAAMSGGVFGRIAAGRSNMFSPVDPRERRHQARREAKRVPTASEHADMGRSERLAGMCVVLWQHRAGQRDTLPGWWTALDWEVPSGPELERILVALDDFARRWHALPTGGAITLTWPDLTRGRPGAGSRSERPLRR